MAGKAIASLISVVFAGSILILSTCAKPSSSVTSSAKSRMAFKLSLPEGYSVDSVTHELTVPKSELPESAATAPSYLTAAEVTITGEGMDTYTTRVDVNNAVASFSVQPGYYTIFVMVWTNLETTFTGAVTVYLHGGDNGTIVINMAVNAPPQSISVKVSNPAPMVGEIITLTCDIVDPDADQITYTWSGGVTGSGPVVTYKVPDHLPHTFTCVADDGNGGVISGSVSINMGGAASGDMDGDGVLDTVDNCPTYPNPGQVDTNVNGVGDICELIVNIVLPDPTLNACVQALSPGLTYAHEVKVLHCSSMPGIGSVAGLEQLPLITDLFMEGAAGSPGAGAITADLTLLATHPSLKILSVAWSQLNDYTQLASLTGLIVLKAMGTTSLTPDGALSLFAAMPGLNRFHGDDSQIAGSLADVGAWPSIQYFWFNKLLSPTSPNTLTGDLSSLAGKSLLQLELYQQASITGDLSSLAGMPLWDLDLCWSGASGDLSSLVGMNLSILRACGSVTGDLASLAGMPLSELRLQGSGFTGSLANISGANMKSLLLNGTSINPDVSLLSSATNPSVLDLSNTLPTLVNVPSLSWFGGSKLMLGGNLNVSCGDFATLIGAIGSPPVDLGSSYPNIPVTGFNCAQPVPDTLPPLTMAWSDNGTAPGGSGMWDGKAVINEGGYGYCIAQNVGDPAPTPAEVKGPATAAFQVGARGFITVLPTASAGVCTITGLTAATTYDFYFVAEDTAFNLQTGPAKVTAVAP